MVGFLWGCFVMWECELRSCNPVEVGEFGNKAKFNMSGRWHFTPPIHVTGNPKGADLQGP